MPVESFSLQGWEVLQVEEGDIAYRLTLTYTAPEPFCPYCEAVAHRHGRTPQFYADTPVQGKRVSLLFHKQRYRCTNCRKTFMEALPQMDEVHLMTRRLRAYIEQEALRRSFISIAGEVGVHEKTVRTIFREYFTRQNKESTNTTQVALSKRIHEFVLERSRTGHGGARSHICEQPSWYHLLQDEQHMQQSYVLEELSKRYAIACLIAGLLIAHKSVLSVIVLGALAQGSVDKNTGIDFLIICRSAIMSMNEREQALTQIGGTWLFGCQLHDNRVFADTDIGELVTENVQVNIHYQTTSWVSSTLKEVFVRDAMTIKHMPDYHYTFIAFLQRGWLLYDKRNVVRKWRESVVSFHRHLKVNVLEHLIPRLRQSQSELEVSAEHGFGPWVFLHYLDEAVDALISILFALNEVYEPEDRRVANNNLLILNKVPNAFLKRLTEVLEGPFDDKGALYRAQLFQHLTTEVLKMAEIELA